MLVNRIWILGAADPEMEMIEALLRECGERVEYATAPSGERIRPGQYGAPIHIGDATTVYTVECDLPLACGEPEDEPDMGQVIIDGSRFPSARSCGISVIRIDHHCPGDPGYGRPPEDFMAASSIGQVISELAKTGALRRAIPKEHEIAHWMASHRDLPVAEYNEMLRTQWFWSRQDMPGPESYPSDGTIARGVSWIYDGYAVAVHQNDLYFEWRVALIPPPLIYAAAADHCLPAAYRGECPGVDPDELMRWRVETRATHQGRPVEDILADVEEAIEEIRCAPTLRDVRTIEHRRVVEAWEYDRVCNGRRPDPDTWYRRRAEALDAVYVPSRELEDVLDLRGYEVPELPEAAAREGVAYLATVAERDGRTKVVLGGHTTPEMVREFMEEWAPAHGLVDAYGDPARGFAGAYVE